MRKVLIVGYNYCYEQEVLRKYKDTLFFSARHIEDTETAERIVALTDMFDAILFIGSTDVLPFQVAAVMLKKEILTTADYPIGENKEDNNKCL